MCLFAVIYVQSINEIINGEIISGETINMLDFVKIQIFRSDAFFYIQTHAARKTFRSEHGKSRFRRMAWLIKIKSLP